MNRIIVELDQSVTAKMNYELTLLHNKMTNMHTSMHDQMTAESHALLSQIKWVENKIEAQNEIAAVNTATFKDYRNCHVGKEVVIVATGPSLDDYQPIENAIHIGVNRAYKSEKVKLDFLFVQDFNKILIEKYGEQYYYDYIEDIENENCTKFIGRFPKYFPYSFIQLPEGMLFRMNASEYFVDPSPDKFIYENICLHPLMDFNSVVFPALHFALFTNPKVIYLVGCDASDQGYFSGTLGGKMTISSVYTDDTISRLMEGYHRVKEFAKQAYPETEIVSINPVGLKGLFKDVYTT